MIKKFVLASASVAALSVGGIALAQDDEENQDESSDVIVVQGIRQSIQQSLDVKRESEQVVDSIVAEDIGKFPDNNVVEALQRVTGVQVTGRTQGETSSVTIRGLGDVSTTWNGRQIFTAAGGGVALQDIPANLVSRIDVYKTRAADQFLAGLAGQIDVISRRPLDFDGFKASGSIKGTYDETRETLDPSVSGLLSYSADTDAGRVGALVNLSYTSRRFEEQAASAGAMIPFVTENPPAGFAPFQRIRPELAHPDQPVLTEIPWQPGLERGLPDAAGSTLDFGEGYDPVEYYLARDALFASDYFGLRERPAANIALQWAPDDNSTYTFEYFYQGYRQENFNSLHFTFVDWWGGSPIGDVADNFEVYDGTNIISERVTGAPFGFQSGDGGTSKTDTHVFALNGEWDLMDGALNVVGDLSYQDSEFSSTFVAMQIERVAPGVYQDYNSGDGFVDWYFLDDAGNRDDDSLSDPGSWWIGPGFDNKSRDTGDAVTVAVNADYDLSRHGDFPWQTFEFGFRHDVRGATSGFWEQAAIPSLGAGVGFTNAADYFGPGYVHEVDDFWGRSDVPTTWVAPSGRAFIDDPDAFRQLYADYANLDLEYEDDIEILDDFDVTEMTTSLYAMIDFEPRLLDRPLFVQAGVRYTNVDTDITFLDRLTGETGDANPQTENVLPSLTVNYELTDDIKLRFNYGETVRRPGFGDLNPNYQLVGDITNIGYGQGSGGNPNLEATTSTNYDFSAEWYFGDDDAIYGTLFRREIEGLVVTLNQRLTIPNDQYNTDEFVISQPVNASDGTLEGAELGFVYFPDNLPGLLNGLGVLGSATWLSSEQNIPISNSAGEIIDEENTSFFGVSDFSYNITGAYENGPFGARLSYVWRDDFLLGNETRQFANPLGIWRKPEKSLDLSVNYDLTESFALSLDAVNLTDEVQQAYYKFGDAGGPDYYNFRNFAIGRYVTLGARVDF